MYSYDLQIAKGTSYNISLLLTDNFGNPIDLTTCMVSGFIRANFITSGILLNINPTIASPPSSGIININIPYSGTAQLPIDILTYDIMSYNTGLNPMQVSKVLKGYVYVYGDVTY